MLKRNIPQPDAYFYLYYQKENTYEAIEFLEKYSKHPLISVNMIQEVEHTTLIFDIRVIYKRDVGGSCRGFLYNDGKFLGTIRWTDNENPMKLNGTHFRNGTTIEIRGIAEQFARITKNFIIRFKV